MRLDAVRAVVTGAGGGLGRTFCSELVKAGAKVVGTDFDQRNLEETTAAIGAKSFFSVKGSVSSEEDVSALFQKAKEYMGGCNVLINNAGTLRDAMLVKQDKGTGKGVKAMSKEEWDTVIGVNLTGPFLCAREFAASAIGNEPEAVMVNISSSARNGYVGQSNYSAAKAGLAADTVVWAKELAKHNIRVGAIAPGAVRTKILDKVPPEMLKRLENQVPLRRLGEREEIWLGVKFIVECDYFTGRVIEIDGGLLA